jgi:hypothetical protein
MTSKFYDTRHRGPWDRGAADNYYGRPFRPHYYQENSSPLLKIEESDMTLEELEAYKAGWDDNEASGHKKDWG